METFTKIIQKFGKAVSGVIGTLLSAGQDTIQMVINTILPFMAFIALMIGLITSTGIGQVIANVIKPLGGTLPGMIVLAAICGFPLLSPLLGPGAVIAQTVGVLIGLEIGKGTIPPAMAVPAIYAINAQVGCDFIPVGMAMEDALPETIEIGTPAFLLSRQITGPLAVVVGWLFSFGLYQ